MCRRMLRFLTRNGLLLVWQTLTQKVANRGTGPEVTFGISFQCSLFADTEPFLPLSHLKPTRKAFFPFLGIEPFHHLRKHKAVDWIISSSIQSITSESHLPQLIERAGKRNKTRRESKDFSLQFQHYPTAQLLHKYYRTTPSTHIHSFSSSLCSPHPLHIISTETLGYMPPSI